MKWLLLPTAVLLFAGCTVKPPNLGQLPVPTTSPTTELAPYPVTNSKPALSLTDSIKQQLATKYKKTAGDVEITVSKELEGHAKGMVSFKGENSGAIWLAVLEKGGWILVHDGQGPMTCQLADDNGFPKELVPECVTSTGKLQSRQ